VLDGSSITGFNAIEEESDMIAMSDPSTFAVRRRPEEQGVGRMFCDVSRRSARL